MATKKTPKRATPQRTVRVGCCSLALDLIFEDRKGYTVELGDGTKALNVPKIRLRHDTKKFHVTGLLDKKVDKTHHPWRVYVRPGEEALSVTIPKPAPTRKPKKK